MKFLLGYIVRTLTFSMEQNIIQMTASGLDATVDPFEVIFDYFFAHFGRYFGHNSTNVGSEMLQSLGIIDVDAVFRITPKEEV